MSINDLLDTDLTIILGVIFLSLLFFLVVWCANLKKANDRIYGNVDDYGDVTRLHNVKIVAKRQAPHLMDSSIKINMIVFELENGNRIELAIKDSQVFGVMVEGDYGTLSYQGKRFVHFERNK